jgi:hypothetical protein
MGRGKVCCKKVTFLNFFSNFLEELGLLNFFPIYIQQYHLEDRKVQSYRGMNHSRNLKTPHFS